MILANFESYEQGGCKRSSLQGKFCFVESHRVQKVFPNCVEAFYNFKQ